MTVLEKAPNTKRGNAEVGKMESHVNGRRAASGAERMAAGHLPGWAAAALERWPSGETPFVRPPHSGRAAQGVKEAMAKSAADLMPSVLRELVGADAGSLARFVAIPETKPTGAPVGPGRGQRSGCGSGPKAEAVPVPAPEVAGALTEPVADVATATEAATDANACGDVMATEAAQKGAADADVPNQRCECATDKGGCASMPQDADDARLTRVEPGGLPLPLPPASPLVEGLRPAALPGAAEQAALGPEALAAESRGLEGLMARLEERRAAFENELAHGPQQQPCTVAGHGAAVLDVAASLQAGQAVYVCADCAARAAQTRLRRRLAAAGVPADVRHATLGNFSPERPGIRRGAGLVGPNHFLEKAHLLAAGAVRNLLLAGAPGIGKSHLGAALAAHTLQAGGSVRWADCQRLFADYHAAYETASNAAVLAAHIRPTLLVLDEICLRPLPADGEEILYAILDARHKAGRRTLFLGNAPAKATRDWLGHRLTDRLRSGGIAFCYGEWQSMRGTEGDGAGW